MSKRLPESFKDKEYSMLSLIGDPMAQLIDGEELLTMSPIQSKK
jgi:hypothetical protein